MKGKKVLIIAVLVSAVLLFSGCTPVRCPKCDSDHLREMKAQEGNFSHTQTRLECLDCGNITYEP